MQRVTSALALAAAASLTLSCVKDYGMTSNKFVPALKPEGVVIAIETTGQRFSGELLEVGDAGVVILDSAVRLVPYDIIVSSQVKQVGHGYEIRKRRPPDPDVRERLRLLSRYPYGITPDVLRELMNAHGQTDLIRVDR
jgi:hypothetical protein